MTVSSRRCSFVTHRPDVRPAGQHGRLGCARAAAAASSSAVAGAKKRRPSPLDGQRLAVLPARAAAPAPRPARRPGAPSPPAPRASPCRRRDRAVAGAAAEVAGERVVDPLAASARAPFCVDGEQAHDEARRAEAALAWRWPRPSPACTGCSAPSGACRSSTVRSWQPSSIGRKQDAGVDRLVAQPVAVGPRQRRPCRRRSRPRRSPPWCPSGARCRADSRARSSSGRRRSSSRGSWPRRKRSVGAHGDQLPR